MKALYLIATKPAPTLPDPQKWSQNFHEFIAACLVKDPETRPTSEALLLHPFIANITSDTKEYFAAYLQEWVSTKKTKGII